MASTPVHNLQKECSSEAWFFGHNNSFAVQHVGKPSCAVTQHKAISADSPVSFVDMQVGFVGAKHGQ